VIVYDSAMDDQPWQFDEMKASLQITIEALNTNIHDVAHSTPPASARDRGDEGIAQWNEEVGRTIGVLEAAKKVILARLGPV
jgi:hypothetical protein